MKKSNVYTRTGDRGTTSLVGGERIDKDSVRLESYGTIDELNSWLGLLVAEAPDDEIKDFLQEVQNRLFDIGSYLATAGATECKAISALAIGRIEESIDRLDSEVPPMKCFVLPGGCRESCHAQIARTVCRRAERRIVALSHEATVDDAVMRFVNRLSDWLFVYARLLNSRFGIADIPWTPAK